MEKKKLVDKVMPEVKAADEPAEDEEVVDPMDTLRQECRSKEHVQNLIKLLDECNERVNSKTETTETCVQELMDVIHEVDHCVHKQLFSRLK